MNRKIVSVYPTFEFKGGAENMAISIAKGLTDHVVILTLKDVINKEYLNCGVDFKNFKIKIIRQFHKDGYVFLSHHRKSTTFLRLISYFLFRGKLRIVHVSHNTFSSLKSVSLYPNNNIAVSKTVKENMISYFKLPKERIQVIYNGIVDKYDSKIKVERIDKNHINVLFIGRIVPEKQQVEFVKSTKNKLSDNVKIYFAGDGRDMDELKSEIQDDSHYVVLGVIDIYKEIYKYDYVCLFSENEGLPLSLIEGAMFSKPLITNDLPQSLEVNAGNYSGFVNHSWEEITNCLNNLPSPDSTKYKELSKNSRDVYERLFSYDIMIEKYAQFIDSINWD